MKIYFLRHCKTINNINKLWQGSKTDIDLSQEGKKQNRKLIEFFKTKKLDIVYSSPLKRCLVTASNIAENNHIQLIVNSDLSERDFGDLESKPVLKSQMEKISDWQLNTSDWNVMPIQTMYYQKVKPFLEYLKKQSFDCVVVVTHSWFLRLVKFYFTNEKDPKIINERVENGEYFLQNISKKSKK